MWMGMEFSVLTFPTWRLLMQNIKKVKEGAGCVSEQWSRQKKEETRS